ncbi:transmembrane protein 54a [Pundamilia nyererei]|uniref:Keratinocyte-associated protein 3-like n=1 Tax=Pundamilia nyererei TaxID=303518 RepID=A0A3B4FBK9_9CICH|nr:PREDICTED: keratinocyte-associated protein 3-like [Pundamilia nyererei]
MKNKGNRKTGTGLCCANLKDNKVLMKMGLALVLVGHVNFILGALVHGTVLRHISLQRQVKNLVYPIANIIAIVAGLLGGICGITAIVLSRNKKNRILIWVLLVFSFIAGFLASASTVGLLASVITAIMSKGKALLSQCNAAIQNISSFSITNECPFDPTRIYATTIILWLPLIFMSVVEAVFSFHCFAACTSFLYLCPCRKRPRVKNRMRRSAETTPALQYRETDTEVESTEQDDLLDSNTAGVQSDLL